ncbi:MULTISPECIES: FAD-dependent oxidoreductase [unclassified Sphingomonas]|uniref:FAD-dependent oxidoreductase n=1 Tax=unclassified Sphingomonas TaxID=196159 RepID=UPI0021507249|nr:MULTISPECIES: FAD-dependent oxidoreductase [unclassified Sphingomonas]MCR5872356.1 FAD-dependent oxidoreductase [Sphingomonas sp. J344]UUX99349.1 FAD-dependent oxidoreductase [Sphingomonas sp. J315]
MRHIAVIGSGPAGYYTAEACQKQFGEDVRVDIIDRLPVPFGLIRSGVAPDHQSIKGVSRRYEAVALTDNVRFVGNVTVGKDVTIPEMMGLYDAVVLATGAPFDRPLEIPGADLPGVTGSAAFVGWYNGHPDFAELNPPLGGPGAVVIGNGNVALDVARLLAKTRAEFAGSDIVSPALDALTSSGIETITLLGRRGPHQIAMTPKELGELAELARAAPVVDAADFPPLLDDAMLEPGHRKSVTHLRNFAAASVDKPVHIIFDFFAQPIRIEGDGRAERVIVERTRLDERGAAVGTGETYAVPASLVVSCIGYRTPKIEGVPYDDRAGRFANDEGRILPGLYAVGWARRGPTGTIGTNRPDGFAIAEKIAEDAPGGSGKAGRPGLDALLASRNVDVVTFRDWQKIDAAEIAAARTDSPREKFTSVAGMLEARGG